MRQFVISSVLIALLWAGFASAQAPQQQTGDTAKKKARVEGTVLSSTGAPIPRATVRLQPQLTPGTTAGTPALPSTATAGQDGTFVVENLEPGTYQVTAQRPGFVNAIYGQRRQGTPGTPIVLAEGQTLKGIDIAMTPQGVISGRITDQNGDAIQSVQVMVLRQGYQRGQRTLVQAGSAASNDLGEYRIANLPPGQYVLAATDRRALELSILGATANTAQAGRGREGNVTTYYPNATDPKAAAPITITPGADLRGTDIRMRTGKLYSFSGKAIGPGGAPAANTILSMVSRDAMAGNSLLTTLSRVTMQVRPDGSFSTSNLMAGSYILMTMSNVVLNGQPTPNLTGRAEITVSDADIKDFVFTVGPGGTLTGTVSLDGGAPIQTLFNAAGNINANASATTAIAAAQAGATIAGAPPTIGLIETANQLGNPSAGKLNPDGTFKIENIGPSRFGVVVGGMPQGYYLKSARLGGADVLKTGVDFTTGGGGTLTVVLSNKSANVTGVVRNSKSETQSGQAVAFWTAEPDFGSQNSGVRTSYTDQNGGFRFVNIPPGLYYVVAFEDAELGQIQNRELLKLAMGDGEEVKLEESANVAKELKAISAEALAQYMAKLP